MKRVITTDSSLLERTRDTWGAGVSNGRGWVIMTNNGEKDRFGAILEAVFREFGPVWNPRAEQTLAMPCWRCELGVGPLLLSALRGPASAVSLPLLRDG